jgi:hypothetical protein
MSEIRSHIFDSIKADIYEKYGKGVKDLFINAIRKEREAEIIEIIDKCWNKRKQHTSKILFMMNFKEELIKQLKEQPK